MPRDGCRCPRAPRRRRRSTRSRRAVRAASGASDKASRAPSPAAGCGPRRQLVRNVDVSIRIDARRRRGRTAGMPAPLASAMSELRVMTEAPSTRSLGQCPARCSRTRGGPNPRSCAASSMTGTQPPRSKGDKGLNPRSCAASSMTRPSTWSVSAGRSLNPRSCAASAMTSCRSILCSPFGGLNPRSCAASSMTSCGWLGA